MELLQQSKKAVLAGEAARAGLWETGGPSKIPGLSTGACIWVKGADLCFQWVTLAAVLRTDSEGSGCSRRRPRRLQRSRQAGQSRASASDVEGERQVGPSCGDSQTWVQGPKKDPGWQLVLDLSTFVRTLFRVPEGLSPSLTLPPAPPGLKHLQESSLVPCGSGSGHLWETALLSAPVGTLPFACQTDLCSYHPL